MIIEKAVCKKFTGFQSAFRTIITMFVQIYVLTMCMYEYQTIRGQI